ncbi:MAG: hypothetical protein NTX25_13660 [Proteobacteria bacterium]|nr:hypothetical protein [Pseudomonadota bacterium]
MAKQKNVKQDPNPRIAVSAGLEKKPRQSFFAKLLNSLLSRKSPQLGKHVEGPSSDPESQTALIKANPLEVFLRRQAPSRIKEVLLGYTVRDTLGLLQSLSEETREFILNCLDRDSSLSYSLTYFLSQPTEFPPPARTQKTIEDLVLEIQLSQPALEAAPMTLNNKTTVSIPAALSSENKTSDRATRKSLSLPPAPASLDLHLCKTVLLYSFENPNQDSVSTAEFLSELGLSIKASKVEEIWQRYELLDEEQRLEWATQGEDDMIPQHQKAAEIIRQHTV